MTKKQKDFFFSTGRDIAKTMTCADALAYAKKLFSDADKQTCNHDHEQFTRMGMGAMDAYNDMGFNY